MQFVVFKTFTSACYMKFLRENVLLLVKNVHENTSQKVKKDRILKACVRYL